MEASKQEPKKEECVPVATRVRAMTVGVQLHAGVMTDVYKAAGGMIVHTGVVTDLYMAVGGMVVHAGVVTGVVTGMRLGYGQLGTFHGGWTCLVAY
nr:hypothetical protein Itr_chr11CG22410 [Ipomoea trifida]